MWLQVVVLMFVQKRQRLRLASSCLAFFAILVNRLFLSFSYRLKIFSLRLFVVSFLFLSWLFCFLLSFSTPRKNIRSILYGCLG